MDNILYYKKLIKPSWAAPGWLFRPVWIVLYIIIAVTFCTLFYKKFINKISWNTILPFALNLFFNLVFVPIQFGLKNNVLASLDIILFLTTLVWALWGMWTHTPWLVYANIPYLAWGIFATALQLSITYLND